MERSPSPALYININIYIYEYQGLMYIGRGYERLGRGHKAAIADLRLFALAEGGRSSAPSFFLTSGTFFASETVRGGNIII